VHLDVILVSDQVDALFFNVFISCLYMFQATSAHHQEDQLVSIHHLVLHTLVGDCLMCQSRGNSWPAHQTVTHQSVLNQMMYWYKLVLLVMSTCCSKPVEAWNKYIEKECVKLVINQNVNFLCQKFPAVQFLLSFKQMCLSFNTEDFLMTGHTQMCREMYCVLVPKCSAATAVRALWKSCSTVLEWDSNSHSSLLF
jgi:hypothetical protein